MNPTLTPNIMALIAASLVAAGSSIDDNSDIIDMAGYEGVVFVQPITASVDTGVATLTAEQNSANSDTGMAAVAGGVATVIAVGSNNLADKCLVVEVYRPRERYVQAVRTSGVANITYGPLTAILYGAKKKPITQHASVVAIANVTSPA